MNACPPKADPGAPSSLKVRPTPGRGGWPTALAAASAAFLAVAAASAPAGAQSGPEGLWRTKGGKGLVEIRACESRLCGYAAGAGASLSTPASGPETAGEVIFTHFIGGPVVWREGVIRDPRSGRAYAGRLRLLDDQSLRLTGCLTGPLCASEVWTRVR